MRVILIRHAKSSWDDPFADDHARVLNKRGMANATAMGDWLRAQGFVPDQILCSDATRTRQTADRLALDAPITFDAAFYHAAPDTYLQALQSTDAACVALIGHNPGIGLLAKGLVELRPEHPRFTDYPTCAVTVIDFSGPIASHTGNCIAFQIPRELN